MSKRGVPVALPAPVFAAVFTQPPAEPEQLFVGCVDGSLHAVGPDNDVRTLPTRCTTAVHQLVSTSCYVFCAESNGTLRALSFAGEELCSLDTGRAQITALCALAPDTVCLAAEDATLLVYRLSAGPAAQLAQVAASSECADIVTDLAYCDGTLFAANANQLAVFKWDGAALQLEAVSDELDEEILALLVAPAAKKVVCGTSAGLCYFGYGNYGFYQNKITEFGAPVNALAPRAADRFLAATESGEIWLCSYHPFRPESCVAQPAPGADCTVDCVVVNSARDCLTYFEICGPTVWKLPLDRARGGVAKRKAQADPEFFADFHN